MLAHFIARQVISPEHVIAADSVDPSLHPTLAYYRDHDVIRSSGAGALYSDADALARLRVRAHRGGRQVLRAMLVIDAVLAVALAILSCRRT